MDHDCDDHRSAICISKSMNAPCAIDCGLSLLADLCDALISWHTCIHTHTYVMGDDKQKLWPSGRCRSLSLSLSSGDRGHSVTFTIFSKLFCLH